MKDQGTNFKSTQQFCFHNIDGNCHYLESDIIKCTGICNMWCSFNKDVKAQINKRIKEKVGSTDPVTRYELNCAYGHMPKEESIQGVLRDD